MTVWLATKTLDAINSGLNADGGNDYRRKLGQVIPTVADAYRSDEDGYRSHLGASVLGGDCERAVWYGYRWAHKRPARGRRGELRADANARMLRLWNRGHLEEARFIAMLLMIGVQVYQQDEHGNQFRFRALHGPCSGSGDGFAMGVPDLPPGIPALLECKTHGDKSFKSLQDDGVKKSKPSHYVQMQLYMRHFGLQYALYMAVNKNDDSLYAEVVVYDGVTDELYMQRAQRLVYEGSKAPDRVRNASPGFHVCKYLCDYTDVCFNTVEVDRNCRTCEHLAPTENGEWVCAKWGGVRNKSQQREGCDSYSVMEAMRKC